LHNKYMSVLMSIEPVMVVIVW